MKRKLFFMALLVTLISGLSSCYVEGGYGYHHHHHHDYHYDGRGGRY